MATATAILYKRYQSKDGTYPVKIRLNEGATQTFYNLGHKVSEKQFKGGVVVGHPDKDLINSDIELYLSKARTYFSECKRSGRPVNLAFALSEHKSASFTRYLQHRATQHQAAGQIDMMYKANRYAKEFTACFGREIFFDELTPDLLREYDNYLISVPNSPNTRRKKFEFLGKYYANALNEGLAVGRNPFKEHKKGIAGTPVRKEKLTAAEVAAIEGLQLADGPVNDARNAWLLAYYVQGVRFRDVARIMWKDIKGDTVELTGLAKGGKALTAIIHGRLRAILDYYRPRTGGKKGKGFVFPFIEHLPTDPAQKRALFGSRNTVVNRNLKIVAELAEVDKPLSFHISRHTFAQHLKEQKKDPHTIKEALRHGKLATTEKYLAALDDSRIHKEMRDFYGD